MKLVQYDEAKPYVMSLFIAFTIGLVMGMIILLNY